MEESKEGGPAGEAVEGKREKDPPAGHGPSLGALHRENGVSLVVISNGVNPGGCCYRAES